MSTTDQWNSPQAMPADGSYTRLIKNQDDITSIDASQSNYENLSQTAIIADQREKIQKLQLKSANYTQKEIKLKRDRDYLKKQKEKLELTIEKLEEHREQDAEGLLDQERTLSRLQGRYKSTENPNEIKRTINNITKVTKEENKLQKEVKEKLEMTTNNYAQLAEIVPQLAEQLRRLKFYGDRQMNEILLRQIQIYVEQLQEKAKEYSKYKLRNLEDNK